MAKILLLEKGRSLRFILTLMSCFFLATTGWGQTVTTDKDDYAPGEYVIITGTGWEPGERVDFTFVETPKPETCVNSHDNFAIADASGNIFYNGFLIKENHIGVHFVLTATGQSSYRIAVTEFTDANVTFNASGLPSGSTNQITVSWNVTGTGNLPSPSSGNYQFNYPGPSNPAIAVRTTQTITYSFSNVIISGTIYSAPAGSASGNNNGNGAQVITAVYTALACVPPSITTPPTAKTITYGDLNPIYSVTASGDGLSYQWQYNTTALPGTWNNVGTNSNSYTVPSPTVSFSGRTYRVVITGTCGTVTSTPASLTVNKATPTATLAVSNSPQTYTGSGQTATVSISASSVPGTVTNILSGGLATQTNANTYAVTANFVPNDAANYNSLTALAAGNFVIGKANADITVTGYTGTYDALAHGSTGTALGVEGETLSGLDLGDSFTNYPGGTANWTFTDQTGNYEDESGSVEIVINKADATVTVAGTTVTYDGNPHGATGSAVGVNDEPLAGLDLGASFTDVPGGTANWTFTDQTGNYEDESGSVEIVINKADATVTVGGTTVTYDGNPHGATGSAVGVNDEPLAGLDLGASFTDVPGGTANWTFSDQTGNYEDESGSVEIVINKADATVTVAGTTVTYDGNPHGATGSAVGVNDEPLAGLDLGASFTDVPGGTANWTFTDQTGNYEDESGSVEIVINKADATVTVGGTTVTYDGNPHGATGSAVGVNDEPLAGLDLGASFTDVPGGTANWTFSDQTGNYEDESGSVEIVINKADATVTVGGTTVTYDGNPHGATGSAVGVNDEPLAGLDLGASFTDVPGGTANWTFSDQTGNYEDESGSVEIVINKADATVTVGGTTVTYDGNPHGATGSAVGVNDEPLAGLDLGDSFTNYPGGTANWTFSDQTGNYEDESGSVEIVINKADATVTVGGTTVTYDGNPHGATGSAVGVNDEPLAGLDLGDSFTNYPGGTANWTFSDQTGNYEDESGSVEIVINKADATVTVGGTTVTYDGNPHGATGSAVGVNDEPLAGLDLGASFTDVPGGTANWTFTDQTGNYEDESGSVEIVINKADATVTVAGTTVTYDGNPHGATGSAVGVNDEPLAGLDLGASFTDVPGGTANWTFTDQTGNYEDESGSVEIVINKADATVTVGGTTVTYDGNPHGATGSAVGVNDEPLAGLDLGASFTDVPGGTANWTFSDQTGNYEDESGSVEIVINKADATVTVAGTTVTYDGNPHGATGSAVGVNDEPLAGLDLGASFTDVPGGTANWTFTDQTGNYEDESGSVEIVINKADATVTVGGTTVTYDGNPHGATGSAVGVNDEPLAGLDLGDSFTNYPGGTANWTFSDQTGNYEDESGSVEIVINKADATVTVGGTTVTYDGNPHGATGSAVGVNDEPLAGLDLGDSFTNYPGGTANWTFSDQTGNYEDESGSVEIVINKADATVTVGGTTVTYDGNPHGATGSAVGVNDEPLAGLDLGDSFTNYPGGTANWTFSDQTGNYEDESGSVEIVINKADATVTVGGTTVTYDGNPHGATGSAVGVNDEPLAGLDLGDSFTNYPGGTANWTFSDQTGNYEDESGSVEIVINKADATVTVGGTTVTYDGNPHGATGSAVGVNDEPLAGLDLGDSFTNYPGGTANWTFSDQTGNYEDESGSVEIVINKADATVTVGGTTVTYDGNPHGATGSAVGVNDEPLAGLDLGDSFTNYPGGTANWTFSDQTGNYEDESGSVEIVINKADATVTVGGTTVTYDGNPHGATGSAVGVNDEPLAGLDLGASFTDVPGGTANWTFTDQTGNYEDESGSVEIVINKADATVTVAGTTVTYDGNPHGATGSAVGVNDEPLAGLDLGASFTDVPGGTANWTFSDQTGNYEDESGSVEIVINKADATVTVGGTTVTYDGNPHGATGSAVGVNDEPLAGLDLGASFTDVPGGTANWTFSDQTGNYEDESGSVEIVINKALLIVTALDNSKFCGQVNPTFGVSYSGFANGENESVLDIKPTASTSADGSSTGSSYVITASGGVDNNYSFTYVNGTLSVAGVTIDASASSNPVKLGDEATLSAQVSPAVPGVSVTFTLSEYNNSNSGTFAQSFTSTTGTNGIATVTLSNLPSDVYKVTAVAGGGCSSSDAYLPVYDPNGGFVTGGGWIYSVPGNMQDAQAAAEGKANFGFNAKYKTGKNNITEVDGNTNFQFQAGDLHLKSLSHDNMSLVISGAKATYRGVGTVNGIGSHKFLLIAIDGDISGGGGVDKFRIKIWKSNSSEVLYDNQYQVDENSNSATNLGGGSIVIHKPKASGTKMAETTEKLGTQNVAQEPVTMNILGNLAVAPNPVKTDAAVRFSLIEDANVTLRIFDFQGREVNRLYQGVVKANEVKEVNFQRNNLMSGSYIVKLTTDRGHSYDKQIIVE